MTRQVVVDIVGDASKFNRSATDAVNSVDKVSHSFKGAAIAGAAAGVALGAVNAAVDFLSSSLAGASEAAKEDTLSQDRLALAYKNTGKAQDLSIAAIEEAIKANQAKGVSDEEQRAGISDFLDKTGSATKALKLNTATTKLAAAKGLDYATAEGIIKSAAAGKTAALQKAGVEVAKHASITKVATAVNAKFAGSLDAMAQTESGKAAIAQQKLGEAMESVGKIINSIAIVVIPALTGAFADMVTFLTANVGPAIEFVSSHMEVFGPIIAGVAVVIASILVPAFVAWAVSAGAAAVATLAAAAPFVALGIAIAAIVVILQKLGVIDWLIARFNEIAKVAGPLVTAVIARLSAGFDYLAKNVFPIVVKAVGQVAGVITNVAKAVIPPLLGVIDVLGNVFKVVFFAIAVTVKTAIETVQNVLRPLTPVFQALGTVFSAVVRTISDAIGRMVGAFTGAVNRISGPLGKMFAPLWDGFRAVINAIIRGWNSLKFTFPDVDMGPLGHIGGFTVGTPNIPYLHAGGIVPGTPGADVLAILQAGEHVTPRGGGGPSVVINIESFTGSDSDIDRFADRLALRMRMAGS